VFTSNALDVGASPPTSAQPIDLTAGDPDRVGDLIPRDATLEPGVVDASSLIAVAERLGSPPSSPSTGRDFWVVRRTHPKPFELVPDPETGAYDNERTDYSKVLPHPQSRERGGRSR
jgi:hypothetical protein